jgi:glycine/sarcosine N-methyltransferase
VQTQKGLRHGCISDNRDSANAHTGRASKNFARLLADFVDIGKRCTTETPFLLGQMTKHDPVVFDSCLGSGATTIGLKMAGIRDILSNEIDPDMLAIALHEAGTRGIGLEVSNHDWRVMPEHLHGRFDLVACLGNSLTYLFDRDERLKTLRNFAALLAPGGVLVIDERNYQRILSGRFSHSGKFVYCGNDRVSCQAVAPSEDLAIFTYTDLKSGEKGYLEVYPFKRGEMRSLLATAGFGNVVTYSDYAGGGGSTDTEFFQHVAKLG